MEQPPQTPLDYRSPRNPGPPFAHPFFIGLITGSLVSGIVWPLWWLSPDQINQGNWGWLLIAIPGTKFTGTIICLFFPRWRTFGAGLLASIGIGFLIFFGLCAMTVIHSA
jgi:hypothetical protein